MFLIHWKLRHLPLSPLHLPVNQQPGRGPVEKRISSIYSLQDLLGYFFVLPCPTFLAKKNKSCRKVTKISHPARMKVGVISPVKNPSSMGLYMAGRLKYGWWEKMSL